jgi:hypothetical protein
MDRSFFFLPAADAILLLHVLFVLFILLGFILIVVGNALCWSWVRNPWFRIAHIAAIGVVVIQSWFGLICPLTTLETALRSRGGGIVYSGTCMSHWMEAVLYYRAPAWAFTVCYTATGALIVACLFWVRPRPLTIFSKKHGRPGNKKLNIMKR